MDDRSLENFTVFSEWCKQSLEGKSLPDVLRNLSRETIPAPSDDTLSTVDAVKLALQSFRGVQNFMNSSAGQTQNRRTAPKSVRAHWRSISAWMVYLDIYCITRKQFGETLMAASLHAIALTSAAISWHPTIRDAITQTSGLVSLLTRHWKKEDEYVCQSELRWEERYFAVALGRLFQYTTDNSDVKIVTFITKAGGGPSAVTQVSLEQLRSVLKTEKVDFSVVSFYINLIHQASKATPSLRASLLGEGLVPAIAQFIDLLPMRPPATVPPNLQQCIKSCILILVLFMETANGPSFIAEAFDAGLLKGFLRLWPWLVACRADTTLSERLFNLLTDYLVYRSVLRSLGKALKKMDQLHIDASLAQCNPWLAFRDAASMQLNIKKNFDARSGSRLEPGFFGCENFDCHLRSEDVTYRRCGGCHIVMYCSESCQCADWRKHRDICKAGQKSICEGGRPIISRHDRNFIHFMIQTEVCSNIASARIAMKQKHPTSLVSSLYVNLFYIGPRAMVVSLASEQTWDDDEKVEMENLLRQAREDEGRRILVNAAVRQGYSLKDGPMMRTYPLVVHLAENLDEKLEGLFKLFQYPVQNERSEHS